MVGEKTFKLYCYFMQKGIPLQHDYALGEACPIAAM